MERVVSGSTVDVYQECLKLSFLFSISIFTFDTAVHLTNEVCKEEAEEEEEKHDSTQMLFWHQWCSH